MSDQNIQKSRVIVFEGPDGVGKTTLAKRLKDWLKVRGLGVYLDSSPGKYPRTLGTLVYTIHHSQDDYFDYKLPSTSIQLLHVSAHIDMLENRIKPALTRGKIVILDRFWWSMQVYGKLSGIPEEILEIMMTIESRYWSTITPIVLLIDNEKPHSLNTELKKWQQLRQNYLDLANANRDDSQVTVILNDDIEDSFSKIVEIASVYIS